MLCVADATGGRATYRKRVHDGEAPWTVWHERVPSCSCGSCTVHRRAARIKRRVQVEEIFIRCITSCFDLGRHSDRPFSASWPTTGVRGNWRVIARVQNTDAIFDPFYNFLTNSLRLTHSFFTILPHGHKGLRTMTLKLLRPLRAQKWLPLASIFVMPSIESIDTGLNH
jgi:hypothetical protein